MIKTIIFDLWQMFIALIFVLLAYMLFTGKLMFKENNKDNELDDQTFIKDKYDKVHEIEEYMQYVKELYICKKITDEEFAKECDYGIGRLKEIRKELEDRSND